MVTAYAPPRASLESHTSAETERRLLLSHERAVRSVGSLHLLGAIGAGLGVAFGLFAMVDTLGKGGEGLPVAGGIIAFFLALTALHFWIGSGLRRLDSSVRGAAGLLSVIGLLGVPLGTLINAYVLYLLFSAKGERVLSPEYQQVIAQTPHVRARTSPIVWVAVGLFLLGIGAAVVIPILARFN